MKVEVKESSKKAERPFPKLMVNHHGAIVLMHNGRGHGTILKPMGNTRLEFLDLYRDRLDITSFIDFEGEITLSND